MKRILFICLGNICRSPMAEFVFKDMVRKSGLQSDFYIESAATSREEEGSPVHHGTKKILQSKGISCDQKRARTLTKDDYQRFDYIIGMEERNLRSALRILGSDPDKKLFRLCDFTQNPRDIADPWYTGNFELTYDDISDGCTALLRELA